VAPRRLITNLLGGFSSLALVLASIGLHGVIAYSVGQRTHEIGICLAIGAQTQPRAGSDCREGLKLAMIGVALGLITSLLVTRVFRDRLRHEDIYHAAPPGHVEQGELKLEDPVATICRHRSGCRYNGKLITLLHLATHTSGLPRIR